MRWPCVIALLLVAACRGEPDFDERFEEASQEIEAKAQEIDVELKQRGEQADTGNSGDASVKETAGPGL